MIIETTDPYVPAIIRKVPATMTKAHQATISFHFVPRLGVLQLSYSHMPAMGWKHMGVPSRAPTSDTRSLKTGIALAMM